MATILKFKCPDCAETYKWPGSQKWPSYCPMCQAALTTRADDEICMPSIRTARMSIVDKVYNDMSAASVVRQEMAAETLGISKNDVADLKISNLRDDKDPNIAPHIPVVNDVSRMMDAAPSVTGFQNSDAVEYSAGTQVGPYANRGAQTQQWLRGVHAQNAGWGALSDNPGKETLQPGYRRRT